ncbi:helix-turn-helix domain-containing protein [Brucella intermedia]|uniref:helix-turn-helix domain-containing protein n=1 Tax=Brucella intermedia TaxID=94625 RepID=UPI002248D9BE|nr:XRE family transcriptional regulator [Brucella intermedia]
MSQRVPKIGPAIHQERKARKLTLEQLAVKSGVSKSMLSQIERGQANPTFAVVWSLTKALNIEFSELVGGSVSSGGKEQIEVTSAANTPEIRSEDGLCRLRILSSPQLAGAIEWYNLEIDPGGELTSSPHAIGTSEHFTALSDGLEVRSGDNTVKINAGGTARYSADVAHSIRNVSGDVARGFLVVLYK